MNRLADKKSLSLRDKQLRIPGIFLIVVGYITEVFYSFKEMQSTVDIMGVKFSFWTLLMTIGIIFLTIEYLFLIINKIKEIWSKKNENT